MTRSVTTLKDAIEFEGLKTQRERNQFVGTWGKEKNGPEDLLTGRAMTRINIDYVPNQCLDDEGESLQQQV